MRRRDVYELYGLTVESDVVLPARRRAQTRPDVRLELASASRFAIARGTRKPRRVRDWFHSHTLPDGSTYLCWTDLFEFLVDDSGRKILCNPLQHATQESLNTYLLGHVLSHSLLAFGVEPLHGSAVRIGRQAVGILGNCGRGKSTLAAALLSRGFPIVTDDLIALERSRDLWMLHPGVPRIKLFPSTARRVLGRHGGHRMNPGTSKLVLPLASTQVARRSLPLKVLYVLDAPRRPLPRPAPPVCIEPVVGRRAFLAVIRASFNLVALDRARLANQFAIARELSSTVPVRRLTYRRSYEGLEGVCDAIAEDLKSL